MQERVPVHRRGIPTLPRHTAGETKTNRFDRAQGTDAAWANPLAWETSRRGEASFRTNQHAWHQFTEAVGILPFHDETKQIGVGTRPA